MVALRATAPDHSRSRWASIRSAWLVPGFPNQYQLGIFRRQIELGPESAEVGKIHIGLSRNHQLLAGSIEPGGIERLNVIDDGEIVGTEVMGPVGSIEFGQPRGRRAPRFGTEIIQATNAGDYAVQRCGNPDIRRIGEVCLAVHVHVM